MTATKKTLETYVDFCFADDPLERPYHLHKFIEKYGRGEAGSIWANLCIEDDRLVVELCNGFHCIHIPLNAIEELQESLREAT